MGTRVNYEIAFDADAEAVGSAVTLFSNSSHGSFYPEVAFGEEVARQPGATSLVRALLAITYPTDGCGPGSSGQSGQSVFTVDLNPGDRERVYTVSYDGREPVITVTGEDVEPPAPGPR